MTSRLIPKETLTAFQRWEMASFDPAPQQSARDLAAAELDRLRAEARAAGHREGYEAGLAAGHAAGYAAGHEAGMATGLAEARAEAAQLAALAASFKIALDAADAELADTLITLAFDVARQVLRQNLALDPTALLGAAREVLAGEPALVGQPHLLVNPADLPIVEAYLKEELQTGGWTVRGDVTVERGGCRARAATGEVDATLPTRWQRVAQAMGRSSEW